MRDFVATYFPAIAVLYANLTPEGPAGITFADRVRGPTIVINLDGKNVNPGVRRFSLAHELCHVLADWSRRKPLALLSGFLSESGLEVEQRANGFAVRLICPESHIHKIKQTSTPTEIRDEIAPFGLHYSALRLYLHKEANVKLSPRVSPELAGIGTEERWRLAEAPDGVERFPLDEVRPERRTLVAQTAATLYSDGKISRRAFAELLGVSPILDVEVVIDHFGLDRPDEDE